MNEPLPLETEHLSAQGPRSGNTEGGSLTRDFEGKVRSGSPPPQGTCRSRLWRQLSLSVGAPLGWVSSYWELQEIVEGELWKRGISLCGRSVKGTWRRAPLLGTPKDMKRKALEMGISLHSSPAREPERGLIYQGLQCKRTFWKWVSLSP